MSPDIRALADRPVIIGAGIAGLMTALELAPLPVVLMSATALGGEASSALAQGGMAAALGSGDSPALHAADTCSAGDGMCDVSIVERIVEKAPEAVAKLEQLGVVFDRAGQGGLALGLEAAHGRRRIVHAGGDATGQELVRALVAAVRASPSITVLEGFAVRRLVVEDGTIAAVVAAGETGVVMLATDRIVLATGGIGGLYHDTTNPLGCFGQGLALAARAGAELADLEFVQFHPTALDVPARPMRLVSEAVRGEGAVLIDEKGRRFLGNLPGAELASRDIVARGVSRHLAGGHRVFLDTRDCLGARFAERFPAIAAYCREAGIDPSREPIPVRPAAHYHMGGIAVDDEGRSSVPGLWACGEVASTGLHGANRLASNSLTEATVSAEWVARSVASASSCRVIKTSPTQSLPAPAPGVVRDIVSASLGVARTGEGLSNAITRLAPLATGGTACADPAAVALMMAVSALWREESRGAHFRSDFPSHAAAPCRSRLTLEKALAAAAELDPVALPRSA